MTNVSVIRLQGNARHRQRYHLDEGRVSGHGYSRRERLARDENLRRIRKVGRKKRKQEVGYNRWCLVETTVYRIKTIFGDRLNARELEVQTCEIVKGCGALNRVTLLGMPDSYIV